MKKTVIVLSFLMLLPLNALALQTLSEGDMSGITGQAGVSIAIDDVKLYQSIEYLTYTDGDGTGGAAGSVSIENLYMMVNINAITHLEADLPVSPGRALLGTYNTTDLAGNPINYNNNDDDTAFEASALTIDVGDLAILSEGKSYNVAAAPTGINIVGVRIGLPTMEIHQTALEFDITVSGGTASPLITDSEAAANSGLALGTISIGNMTMGVLDGFVEIASH